MYDMGGIFGAAFNRVATPEKAVKGFGVAGLWPIDEGIFTDDDYAPSMLTEEPPPAELQSASKVSERPDRGKTSAARAAPGAESQAVAEPQPGLSADEVIHSPAYEREVAHCTSAGAPEPATR